MFLFSEKKFLDFLKLYNKEMDTKNLQIRNEICLSVDK